VSNHMKFPWYIQKAALVIANCWKVSLSTECNKDPRTRSSTIEKSMIVITIHIRDGNLYGIYQWKVKNLELQAAFPMAATCIYSFRFGDEYPGSPWKNVAERDDLIKLSQRSVSNLCLASSLIKAHVVLMTLEPFVLEHQEMILKIIPCAILFIISLLQLIGDKSHT
jgi:hypothetical protein